MAAGWLRVAAEVGPRTKPIDYRVNECSIVVLAIRVQSKQIDAHRFRQNKSTNLVARRHTIVFAAERLLQRASRHSLGLMARSLWRRGKPATERTAFSHHRVQGQRVRLSRVFRRTGRGWLSSSVKRV